MERIARHWSNRSSLSFRPLRSSLMGSKSMLLVTHSIFQSLNRLLTIKQIEKLIFTNNNHAGPSTQAGPSTTQANSSPRSSSTATPPQSVQNSEVSSPQSTALSSTCGDAGSNEKGKGVAIDA